MGQISTPSFLWGHQSSGQIITCHQGWQNRISISIICSDFMMRLQGCKHSITMIGYGDWVFAVLHSWWMFFCILKLLDVILMSSMRFGGFLMLTALLCLESRSFRQFLHVFGMFSKSLVTLQPRLNRVCCCSEHQASRLRTEANSQPTLEVEEVRCQMAA